VTDAAGSKPDQPPAPTRKAQSQKYDQLQAEVCQEIDDLLQQAEAVLATKQFDEARHALNTVYRRINKLAALYNRRGGKPRKELKRLIRYYALYQRALVGAVAATKGELNAARVLLPLVYQQSKQLKLLYPESPDVRRLATKIRSWQKLLKHAPHS
jgi:hypothetical protein